MEAVHSDLELLLLLWLLFGDALVDLLSAFALGDGFANELTRG